MNDYLGPVGCSSGAAYTLPAHLHVALNNQTDNPLFYLAHGNHGYPINTDARFTVHASASVPDDSNYIATATIATTGNYDLDKVEFLVDGNLQSAADPHRTGSVMQSRFIFGGKPDNYFDGEGTPSPAWITSENYKTDGTITGVKPLYTSDGTPSNYLFVWNGSYCNLPPGGHRFTVKAVDVNGYITTNGKDFSIGVFVGTQPGDYSTIQAAINAAGDDCKSRKITVRDGTYVEHIDFKGKAVWLRSEHGADKTIIDGSGSPNIETVPTYINWTWWNTTVYGSVVTFNSGENLDSILDGFTITNGKGTITINVNLEI